MLLVQHDDMVETLTTDTANDPLAVRILPRDGGAIFTSSRPRLPTRFLELVAL